MPRKAFLARQQPAVTPTPELAEPYGRYLYAELRHEISVRQIRVQRQGPQRVTTRAGFIATLQDWDKTHNQNQPKFEKTKIQAKPSQKPMAASGRTVRARRGCRFRLVNVLLSPDFNGRWGKMVTNEELELTKLWEDVHAAFMAQNSMLDTLHFQDALFVNITPNVILAHTAPRLMQMWTEIVTMYRNAVTQAREALSNGDNAHSFFDF
ncbi:hypothetical protein BBO99_00008341 [Phytophthora kernoviae]|uniref:Uncharacterized protein n=2 Tax=Phytophthora kernoviae TaxID=325452 RepID=A0A3R7JVP8_9STRA|nr:hypothetical protein G195_009600 [Phytophthora kernoviae 00238/432]KAG2516494.1 hypothetical protein JM18_007962 [Phytophthora kernoviae]KAG2526874.1 hypothetical protein JM16_003649 [Phytophthora kernoviae]RLN31399.1 hypothetical protein BBI17_008290 [Phytophthora kernoviae]RLN75421.1 hypothetical protein BBO99_00008341 [Phytophthora kernoviae]